MPIIVLEGINGAGKTTVGAHVCDVINAKGKSCILIDAAGHGRIGRFLRKQIIRPEIQSTPDVDAMLFGTLRMEGALRIVEILRLEPTTVILLERWSLALGAYGIVDGARPHLVSELRAVLDKTLEIDTTVLLNVSGETAFKRIAGEAQENRFESKGPEYLEKVAAAHRKIASSMAAVTIIDAGGTKEEAFDQMMKVLGPKLDI